MTRDIYDCLYCGLQFKEDERGSSEGESAKHYGQELKASRPLSYLLLVVLCHHCQERIHLEQRHGPEKIHIPEIQFYLGYAHAHFTFVTLGISSEKKIRHDVGKILWWEVSKNFSLCFGDFSRHWSNPDCDSASHNNQVYKRLDHGTTVPKPHLDIQSENRVVLLRVRR